MGFFQQYHLVPNETGIPGILCQHKAFHQVVDDRSTHPLKSLYPTKKFRGPGLRYEVGICIQTGWICWVNGPFPCGAWPDLRIARSALHLALCAGEMYIADGGYAEGDELGADNHHAITPTGYHDFEDRQRATVRARHETVNKRFKTFGALKNIWRHELHKHGPVFQAIASIVQLEIQNGGLVFGVEYDEAEF